MKTENISIEQIKPYKRNTKKHDQTQIDNVAKSIEKYGFVQPLVIDKDGVIVIGHCRFAAAKQIGMKEVPCVRVDDLTPDQVNALRIIDNKTNESPWDMELLPEELLSVDLSDFDLNFSIDDIELPDEDTNDRKETKISDSISVVIDCDTEDDAERIFNELTEEGYVCRISTL